VKEIKWKEQAHYMMKTEHASYFKNKKTKYSPLRPFRPPPLPVVVSSATSKEEMEC
jgi:hypothetical protein